jgi:solute carrier family 5 (sodium-coupled monocarboxylate transporter), member 8/12
VILTHNNELFFLVLFVRLFVGLAFLFISSLFFFLSLSGLVTVFLINFYTGLLTFTHYVECDPLKSGQISAMDQLLPFYVMDVFGHITTITGVFVAGIFAASLG